VSQNIEGTLFATLMGIWNLASLISDYLGAAIQSGLGITETNFDNLWIAILLYRILFVIPIFFIGFIPDDLEADHEIIEMKESGNDDNFVELVNEKED